MRYLIQKYTHGFCVTAPYHNDRQIVERFNRNYEEYSYKYNWKTKQKERELKQTYVVHIAGSNKFGIHISLFDEFMAFILKHGVYKKDIEVVEVVATLGKPGLLNPREEFKPRENQVPILEYTSKENSTFVLPIQMGAGKTYIALSTLANLKVRGSICMGATHVNTWLKDGAKFFTNAQDEMLVARGKVELMKVIELGKADKLDVSIVIITTTTMRDYLTEYMNLGHSTYGCEPHELYNTLGVGMRVTDECHEDLNFNFRHAILTNCNKTLYLSATLLSNNAFTNRMYNVIYPQDKRYNDLEWNKYCIVKALGYNISKPWTIKCSGPMGYSHVIFEGWLLETPSRLKAYLNMIAQISEKIFVPTYEPGQRLLIFVSTIEMRDTVAAYLTDLPAFSHLKVASYASTDPESVILENDILVATPKKAGTGKDIKGLVRVLSTVAIDARERNIQMLGRLREIKDLFPNLDPIFYYLVAFDIAKHVDYHNNKVEIFTPLVKEISATKTGFTI